MTISKRFIILSVIALIAVGIYANQTLIMRQLLPTAATRVIQFDVISDLGEGLHVALCGAGGPMPSDNRSGPCVAVIANSEMFIIDVGVGGSSNLARMGLNRGAIEGVFLTHFHSDHIGGLGELAMNRWVAGSHTSPLTVHGPSGVSEVVAGFNQAYAQDSVHRYDHHGNSVANLSGSGLVASSHQVPELGQKTMVYDKSGLTVEMFAVDHQPISPAVGYLFTFKGRTVLISGDTTKSANIELFSKQVDLLVHEALSNELLSVMSQSAERAGNSSLSKIFHDVLDYHTSPTEVAEIARDADVGHLLYYHIVPPLDIPGLEAIWLDGVDDIFTEYTLGVDGTLFTLPENSTDIIKVNSRM